jgi:hypothetical protein
MSPTSDEKQALVDSIAYMLAIPRDDLGPGSKEHRPFLANIAAAFGIDVLKSDTKHSIARKIITHLGGTWTLEYFSAGGSVQTNAFRFIQNRLREIHGADRATFLESVAKAIKGMKLSDTPPPGNPSPVRISGAGTDFNRCPRVVAWILLQSKGKCERCSANAPFRRLDNTPYLEVHHVRTLATGGPDTVANAVALCPNCHRAAHLSRKRGEIQTELKVRLTSRGYG